MSDDTLTGCRGAASGSKGTGWKKKTSSRDKCTNNQGSRSIKNVSMEENCTNNRGSRSVKNVNTEKNCTNNRGSASMKDLSSEENCTNNRGSESVKNVNTEKNCTNNRGSTSMKDVSMEENCTNNRGSESVKNENTEKNCTKNRGSTSMKNVNTDENYANNQVTRSSKSLKTEEKYNGNTMYFYNHTLSKIAVESWKADSETKYFSYKDFILSTPNLEEFYPPCDFSLLASSSAENQSSAKVEMTRDLEQSAMTESKEELYCDEENKGYSKYEKYSSINELRSPTPSLLNQESVECFSDVTVDNVVRVLSESDKMAESTESISCLLQSDPVTILRVVESKEDIFGIDRHNDSPVVSLEPQLALCLKHLSEGCRQLAGCRDLHICRDFVYRSCKSKDCIYGHSWLTNHNSNILSQFHLDNLDNSTLLKVMKNCIGALEICDFYNLREKKCRFGDTCKKLHICKNYILSSCTNDCSMNHSVLNSQCYKILKRFKRDFYGSPAEILMQVKACLCLSEFDQAQNDSKSKAAGYVDSGKKYKKGTKENQLQHSKMAKKRTLKSTDLCGDVDTPGICVYGIENRCKYTQNGCKYLHAKARFQWQVKDNGKWYNLPLYLSEQVENAFCNASAISFQVSSLDESKLQHDANKYKKMFGTGYLVANFQTMNMSCNNKNLDIRRLSTPSAALLKNNAKAILYEWYFQDENGNWIKYGHVDSLGKSGMVSDLSSSDIEEKFIQDSSSTISFSNGLFNYLLDMNRMVQVNTKTGKERAIRRRPSHLLPESEVPAKDKSQADLPTNWIAMTEDRLLVVLYPDTLEYLKVSKQVSLTLPNSSIVSIKKLQNSYLWQAFQSKTSTLCQQYNCSHIHIESHFHGIDRKDLDNICMENIDWRRESAFEQKHGLGTYFFKSASEARSYCISRKNWDYLILAKVIIGNTTQGKSDYRRPPNNPSTNKPYDTTVDNVYAPTVYVKFEKDEYYPEYIIKINRLCMI